MLQRNEHRYIGDGVYVSFDGYHLILKTGSPTAPDNVIYLDVHVRSLLRELLESFKEGGDNSVV